MMTQDNLNIARDETERLIASNKVEGTTVYDAGGEKLGTIHNFMVEKRTGQVEYAVLRSGGLFGKGDRYYPIPWPELRYDTEKGGYVVTQAREALATGPSYEEGADPRFDDSYSQSLRDHYRR
jgi:sporulation protein YlmC with PRC-barrel domain